MRHAEAEFRDFIEDRQVTRAKVRNKRAGN